MELDEVVAFDMEQLDLRAAVTGLIGLALALVFIVVFGPVGMAAAIAALFVIAAGPGDEHTPDLAQAGFVVVGTLITLLIGYSADSQVAATLTIAGVALAATLAAAVGHRYATLGVYSLLWAVIVLSIGATEESVEPMGLAFLTGGAIGLAAMWISDHLSEDVEEDDEDSPPDEAATSGSSLVTSAQVITVFAVVRALAAGACVYLGYEWFPEHATWAALTFVLVVQPPARQTLVVAVGRTVGTTLGVIVGVLVAQLVDGNDAAVLVAFALSGFGMVATKKVSYAVSTAFTTAMLLHAQQILQENVFSTGWERLEATVLGVVMAVIVMALMFVFVQRSAADTSPVSGTGGQPHV